MAAALVLALALQCTVIIGVQFAAGSASPAPEPIMVDLAIEAPPPEPEPPSPAPPPMQELPAPAALPPSDPAPDAVAAPEPATPAVPPHAPPPHAPPPRPAAPRPARRPSAEQTRVVHSPVSLPIQTSAAPAASPEQAALASDARVSGATATLQGRIRAAIQVALRYPAAAAAMQLTGRAQVQLDYQSGAVRNIQVTHSAGSPLLDRAALSAVRDARYPAAPPEVGDRTLSLLVWVELQMT